LFQFQARAPDAEVTAHSGIKEAPFRQEKLQAKIWGKLSDKCGEGDADGIAVRHCCDGARRVLAAPCRSDLLFPADPTKPLLPNPNSARSESVSVGICRIANGAATRF